MDEKTTADTNSQSEGIYTMYEEIAAEIAQLKRRPPTSAQDLTFVLLRTVMPLIRDLAFIVREARVDIDAILESDEGGIGTQFTEEDAKKFEIVSQFTKQTIATMLPTLMQEQPEEAAKLQFILATADECIAILASAPIVGEEDEDDVDATQALTEQSATQEPTNAGAN